MRRLPPLTAIEAFVQVARLGSVKAAAEELALSSPALSRRVQALERFMGRNLFERRHQAMMLSTDGEMLLSRIAPALDQLTLAIDATSGDSELVRLRLGVMPLFASQRLMVAAARAAPAPSRAAHRHRNRRPCAGSARRGRRCRDRAGARYRFEPLFAADRPRHRGRDRQPLAAERPLSGERQVDDIARLTIFLHRDMPELFNVWREALGRPDLEPAAVDVFDSGQLMLDAAAQGLGVAFMLKSHLDDSHDDRLTNLFDDSRREPLWLLVRLPPPGAVESGGAALPRLAVHRAPDDSFASRRKSQERGKGGSRAPASRYRRRRDQASAATASKRSCRAAGRLALRQRIDMLHARFDHAPDGVLAVEEAGVVEADEELAVGAVGFALRAIEQTPRTCGSRLNSAFRFGLALGAAHAGAGRIAALRHEAGDDAVEDDAVIEAFAGEALDLIDMVGCEVGPQRDDDVAAFKGHDKRVFGIGGHLLLLSGISDSAAVLSGSSRQGER
jgi:LysR family glycine cleavage system transcriptional activator